MTKLIANLVAGLDPARLLELLGTILAIALAIWHGVKLKQQVLKVERLAGKLSDLEKQLTEQVGRGVQEIREALPTKRLGKFPLFLTDIVKLISRAQQTIEIFCDYPAYASFSDSETFVLYKRAIEDQLDKEKHVTIVCLDADARHQETVIQETRDQESWETLKAARFDTFVKYLRYHAPNLTVPSLTNEVFLKLVTKEDDFMLEEIFRRARQLSMSMKPTVYFWLIDDHSMIFVVPSASRQEEQGFFTQDSDLIASLKETAGSFCPAFLQKPAPAVAHA